RPADLRREETGIHAGENEKRGQAVEVGYAHASGNRGNLGVVPLDGKGERSAPEDAKVVGAMGIFPDVFAGKDQVSSKGLLQTGVKFIAPAGRERSGRV